MSDATLAMTETCDYRLTNHDAANGRSNILKIRKPRRKKIKYSYNLLLIYTCMYNAWYYIVFKIMYMKL